MSKTPVEFDHWPAQYPPRNAAGYKDSEHGYSLTWALFFSIVSW